MNLSALPSDATLKDTWPGGVAAAGGAAVYFTAFGAWCPAKVCGVAVWCHVVTLEVMRSLRQGSLGLFLGQLRAEDQILSLSPHLRA